MVKRQSRLMVTAVMLILAACACRAPNLDEERITDYGIIPTPKCYENGAIEVRVINYKEGNIFLPKFIKGVGAVPEGSDAIIDLKRYWYDKEGHWYYPDYTRMRNVAGYNDEAIFISEEYLLNEKGNYTLKISGVPTELLGLITESVIYEFDFECPGYKHACNSLNTRIEECYSEGDSFYAYFTGMGENKYSKINLSRDIEVTLNYITYGGTLGYRTEVPDSAKYYSLGDDRHVLKIPLADLKEPISSIKLHVKGCIEGFHNTSDYSSCEARHQEPASGEAILESVENRTIAEAVLNLSKSPDEAQKELIVDTEEEKPRYIKAFLFIYELVPVKKGALRDFLIELGRL